MLCDICKKRPATIYYKEIKNGEEKNKYLCEECASLETASKNGAGDGEAEDVLGSFLSNILGNISGAAQENKKNQVRCTACNTSYQEVLKIGKFGCANCYEAFQNMLERSLRQIQGANRHIGKKPGYEPTPEERKAREAEKKEKERLLKIEELSAKLAQAVEVEDYEKAARLRDEVRALKGEGECQNGTKNKENTMM